MIRKFLLLALLAPATLVAVHPGLGAGPPDVSGVGQVGKVTTLEAVGVAGTRLHSTISVRNSGASAWRYTLHAAPSGSRALARQLRLRITRRSDGALVWVGSLSGLHTLDLGMLRAGQGESFAVDASVPATVPGAFAADSTVGTFRVVASLS
jgi:hypothetical protein